VNGYMLDEGDEGKYFTMDDEKKAHFFSPRIGFTAKYPLSSSLCVNFEGFINPFYCIVLEQNLSYHSDQTSTPFDYSGKNNVSRFSSPFIETKLSLDMFRFLRLMTRLSYQRLDFQQMDWNSDFDGLEGKDDVQTITKWRGGIELLSVNRKNARIRGGIYREESWNKSSYMGKTQKDGKWVFCIGTEF